MQKDDTKRAPLLSSGKINFKKLGKYSVIFSLGAISIFFPNKCVFHAIFDDEEIFIESKEIVNHTLSPSESSKEK